eukprot:g2715.t1
MVQEWFDEQQESIKDYLLEVTSGTARSFINDKWRRKDFATTRQDLIQEFGGGTSTKLDERVAFYLHGMVGSELKHFPERMSLPKKIDQLMEEQIQLRNNCPKEMRRRRPTTTIA